MADHNPLDSYRDHLIDLAGKMQLQLNHLRAVLGQGRGAETNGQSLQRDMEGAGGRPDHEVKEEES